MRATYALVALCLVGCAPSAPQQPRVDSGEEQAAAGAYQECLSQAARDLDDHRSDASTIALAVVSACNAQRIQLEEVYARGLSGPAQVAYWNHIRANPEVDVELATRIVLQERASTGR